MVKDLSGANRAVNRLKQTEDVGLLIHAIPLVDHRTVYTSDAALDLEEVVLPIGACAMRSGKAWKSWKEGVRT